MKEVFDVSSSSVSLSKLALKIIIVCRYTMWRLQKSSIADASDQTHLDTIRHAYLTILELMSITLLRTRE